jgi:adenylate cyclase class IV
MRIRRKKDYRELKDIYLLTIKKKNLSSDIKEREEFEVAIKDINAFDKMFRAMSLLPRHIKEKVRSSYEVEDVVMDIDLYYHSAHNIPPLLEIEGKDKSHIRRRIRKLNLENHKIVNWSSRQLLKSYNEWPAAKKTKK